MKATNRTRYGLLSSFLTAFLFGGLLLAQSADEVKVSVGKSVVIDYPEDISRISTSSPDIVDAVPATTREILLHGKGLGSATVIVWSNIMLAFLFLTVARSRAGLSLTLGIAALSIAASSRQAPLHALTTEIHARVVSPET